MANADCSKDSSLEDIELWKDVLGFEGLYEVSSRGNVRSSSDGQGRRKGWVCRLSPNPTGYITYRFYRSGKGKTLSIHRVVFEVFSGRSPNGFDINHINGVKTDNRIENLEIVTRAENMAHARRTGLTNNYGETNNFSRLTEMEVKEIRREFGEGVTMSALARRFGLKPSSVWAIVHRKSWKHLI